MAHGVADNREIASKTWSRDTRPLSAQFVDFLASGDTWIVSVGMLAIAWRYDWFGPLTVLVTAALCMFRFRRNDTVAFFKPKSGGGTDKMVRKPGSKKPQPSEGIFYFGNTEDGKQAWFPAGVMRQHYLFLSTTGGGKTFSISSVLFNAILQGSGFVYIDGKGEAAVAHRIQSLARMCGREDDVFVVNLMSGNREIYRQALDILTNTINPMADGSSSAISELVKSLLADSKNTSGGDMWKTRAESLIDAVLRVRVFLRDEGVEPLSASILARSIDLSGMAAMMKKAQQARERALKENRYIPPEVFEGVRNYLTLTPGFTAGQVELIMSGTVPDFVAMNNMLPYEQHGYVVMQIAPVLNMLAFDYGHIFNVLSGDVDYWDCATRRRIVVVLLPVLEKSEGSIASLGKIQVSALRGMMARALGNQIEGDAKKLAKARPTAALVPYNIFFDEIGYYLVNGLAAMLAQARSLGFSIGMGAQDINAMEKNAPEESRAAIGNTNIKMYGKIEDPDKTMEFIKKRVDEADVAQVSGYETSDGMLGDFNMYQAKGEVSLSRRARLSIRDLADLREGEAYVQYGDRIARLQLATVDVPDLREARINVLIPMRPPSRIALEHSPAKYEPNCERFRRLLSTPGTSQLNLQPVRDLQVIIHAVDKATDKGLGALDRGAAAAGCFRERLAAMRDEGRRQREAARKRRVSQGGPIPAGPIDPWSLDDVSDPITPDDLFGVHDPSAPRSPGANDVLNDLMDLYKQAVSRRSVTPADEGDRDSADSPADAPRPTPGDLDDLPEESNLGFEPPPLGEAAPAPVDPMMASPDEIQAPAASDPPAARPRSVEMASEPLPLDDVEDVDPFWNVQDPSDEAEADMALIDSATTYPKTLPPVSRPDEVAAILRDMLGEEGLALAAKDER